MVDWIWIEQRDALAVHERVLRPHGGAQGVRDQSLLDSALARPRNLAAYDGTAALTSLAASYTAGIVQNHPFTDGNKRTGFVLGVLFLELNSGRLTASEPEAARMVLALAAGHIDQAAYEAFLAANTTPHPKPKPPPSPSPPGS